MNILSLDVGGTAIKSALLYEGKIKSSLEIPSEGKLGGSHIIKNILKTIDFYEDYDVIGISTTGQVDSEQGLIVYANENVPDYTGTPLCKIIQDQYHKPVFVENDVNAAAIGEGFWGAARNEKDYLCLTIGTGIGGAIVLNKQVYKGANGAAGEFGHIITHIDGVHCTCGKSGCYEQYASTTALLHKAIAYDETLTDGYRIFSEMLKGNQAVKQIVDSWIDEIIIGLVTLIHIFNPHSIILGGGIMKQEYILESIRNRIADKIMDNFKDVSIVAAELGNYAGVYGMSVIATERMNS